MKNVKAILVPTDFSDLSLAAMEYAISFSTIYDARICVIHVVENAPVAPFCSVDFHSETTLQDPVEKANKDLQDFMTYKLPDQRNIVMIVRRGEGYKEIIKFAQDERIDLIIMATHGRTGLAHVVMGSVAEKVVRYSTVPVLIVKPKQVQEKLLDHADLEEQLRMK